MTFLLDENVEHRIATFLRNEGPDVTTIVEDYTRSIDDREVLHLAQTEGRILITNDRDCGELIFSQQLPHTGVIYFRLPLDADGPVRRGAPSPRPCCQGERRMSFHRGRVA